jgi:hypothetical protein
MFRRGYEICGLATFLKTHQKGGAIYDEDSAGGTPTDAVETTALPEKSLMIVVSLKRYASPADIQVWLTLGHRL